MPSNTTSPSGHHSSTSPPEHGANANGHHRPACTECQRRKQKCNREWPCNHCQKRKVADRCRFTQDAASNDKSPAAAKKRARAQQDASDDESDDGQGLEAIGYMHTAFFNSMSLTKENKTKNVARQYLKTAASCPQLKKALELIPSRTTTDVLVQNFLHHVNYHYYIIYPSSFLQEYRDWWADKQAGKPLGLQWTCLLLTICACSSQCLEASLQHKLEAELSEPIEKTSVKFHSMARELHGAVPVSYSHIIDVQQLMHSCLWYKYEARFVESWHVLGVAIREAQELCINHESKAGPISEFESEMRRRVWCVLDTWDWQISALLSRPRIIDRTDCDVQQPSLTLEGHTVSPLLHMKLQSQLIGQLSFRFGVPKNATSIPDVQDYVDIVQEWAVTFPPQFAIVDPDTSLDSQNEYVSMQRHYLHSASYWMTLDPLRSFMCRAINPNSHPDERRFRSLGVDCSIRLLDSLIAFFYHIYPADQKFHFVLFSVFDVAALLCSTLMHDEDSSLDRRREAFKGIKDAMKMLQTLSEVSQTAVTSHQILLRLTQRIAAASEVRTHQAASQFRPGSRAGSNFSPSASSPASHAGMGGGSVAQSDFGSPDGFEYFPVSPNDALTMGLPQPGLLGNSPNGYVDQQAAIYSTMPPPAAPMVTAHDGLPLYQQMTGIMPGHKMPGQMYASPASNMFMAPTPQETFDSFSIDGFSDEQLGNLATLWNYQNLDLNFVPQA